MSARPLRNLLAAALLLLGTSALAACDEGGQAGYLRSLERTAKDYAKVHFIDMNTDAMKMRVVSDNEKTTVGALVNPNDPPDALHGMFFTYNKQTKKFVEALRM